MARPSTLIRAALVLLAAAAFAGPGFAADVPSGDWNFQVSLDGNPIGEHRFHVTSTADGREVVSEADFSVRILGITAYHYHHAARETWRAACLTSMVSSTDDNGKALQVRLERKSDRAAAGDSPSASPLDGCVMSFAYWNPAIRTQTHLLNAQTGKLDAVKISPLPAGTVDVRGKPVAATGFRIAGPADPIDVWYGEDGSWIGLDSVVSGGKKLSYRLP